MKEQIKQKEDAKKPLTTNDSEASDKCENPPIVPRITDTQMFTRQVLHKATKQ